MIDPEDEPILIGGGVLLIALGLGVGQYSVLWAVIGWKVASLGLVSRLTGSTEVSD